MNGKVRETLFEYQMIAPNDTVIVGTSGGADSMCLLDILFSMKEDLKIEVQAVHINHLLRGEVAFSDEAFVAQWCKERDIKCHIFRVDIAKISRENGIGEEECGRKERYRIFNELSVGENIKIATAHTLSDTAETVLFNLVRGTGSRGLCGIPPVRGNIIRPIIRCTRVETEEYCKQKGIDFRIDETNADETYSRNHIRAKIVPEMCLLNKSFHDSIHRMTVQLSEQEEYLNQQADLLLARAKVDGGFSAEKLAEESSVISVRALLREASKNGATDLDSAAAERIKQLICREGAVSLHGKVNIRNSHGKIFFENKDKEQQMRIEPIKVNIPSTVDFAGKSYNFIVTDKKDFDNSLKVYKKLLYGAFDYDKMSTCVIFRTRSEGDVFKSAKRGITKTVKKLFNEAHIPVEERDRTALLESNGEIVWIEGFGISSSVTITEKTNKIVLMVGDNHGNQES